MVHLVSAPPNSDEGLLFNVDGAVGAPPATNKREDVLFVQFAIRTWRRNYSGGVLEQDQGLMIASRDVWISGTADSSTIESIREWQLSQKRYFPGTIVDGRVSPMRHGRVSYGGAFGPDLTIMGLNRVLLDATVLDWPRIDRLPECPEELKQMMLRVLGIWTLQRIGG